MKKLYILMLAAGVSGICYGQGAVDAYNLSQPDMKGTARFMSMGGAFGALGGDLSTLSQNPAGIGVYRSNEIGMTLNLDCQHSSTQSSSYTYGENQTKFLFSNIGGVATIRLNSTAVPNINFGFSYNRVASFNRKYQGYIPLQTSLSNYIAGVSNDEGLTVADVETTSKYDPYNPTDGGITAPWLSILGYDSYLIDPEGDPDSPTWNGQWENGKTSGIGAFSAIEKGGIDEYNIAIGGNISNVVYWGMNFDIVNIDYRLDADWAESLTDAYVYNDNYSQVETTNTTWRMNNLYRASGTGFNYQLGVIVKPIQELRLGFAFHTPTWYNITETYNASVYYNYPDYFGSSMSATTNNGVDGYNDVSFRSPWKLIASAAGVIGSKFIISADYQWDLYKTMKYSAPKDYTYGWYTDYDWGYDWLDYMTRTASPYNFSNTDEYSATNTDIKNIYRTTQTIRLGAEYRVTPKFSVRAGYSHVSSPVVSEAKDNKMTIWTAGSIPSYRFDNDTNYVTCGLGFKTGGFYTDLAYVYKNMKSVYHAFTPDVTSSIESPQAKVSLNNHQIVLSFGYKF